MYTSRREQPPSAVFPQPATGSEKVWRYLTLPKLLYALDRRALVFSRLDLLKDTHEGSVPRANWRAFETALEQQTGIGPEAREALRQSFKGTPKSLRKTFFVNCWHMNDSDSDAMWLLYCGREEGIALQTTYAKLDESLPNVDGRHLYIGLVRYLNYEHDVQPFDNAFHPAMHKRRAFEHEREVRIVDWQPDHLVSVQTGNIQAIPPVVAVPWNAELVVESVYVNPYADPWYYDAVKAALSRFTPTLVERVRRSNICDDPWADD